MDLYVEDNDRDYGYKQFTLMNTVAGVLRKVKDGEVYLLDKIIDPFDREVEVNHLRACISQISKDTGHKYRTNFIEGVLFIRRIKTL